MGIEAFEKTLPETILMAEKIKKNMPGTTIFLIGEQLEGACRKIVSGFPFVEFTVKGEPVTASKKLAEALKESNFTKIPGVSTIKDGEFSQNKPILANEEDLPALRCKDYYEQNKDKLPSEFTVEVFGSKGCPNRCLFCGDHTERPYRRKPNSVLVDEIKKIKEETGLNHFLISDYNFTHDREKLVEFCKLLSGLEITWATLSRIDDLNEELIDKMEEAGCRGLFLGIESGDPKMQKFINKNIDINKADENMEILSNSKITVRASFIVGFPEESTSSLSKTIEKAIHYSELGASVEIADLKPRRASRYYRDGDFEIFFDPLFYPFSTMGDREEEVKLIGRNPDLFTIHHRFKNKNFSPYYLFLLSNLSIIINLFPKTLISYKEETSTELLKLFNKLMGVDPKNVSKKEAHQLAKNFQRDMVKSFFNLVSQETEKTNRVLMKEVKNPGYFYNP